MARMLCVCDHMMGTSDCPSPYGLDIYYDHEVQDALDYDPNITLTDFINEWDEKECCEKSYLNRNTPVEYWYCTECKRLYELQSHTDGNQLRVYCKDLLSDQEIDVSGWKRIHVFPEVKVYDVTEEDYYIRLSDYLKLYDNNRFYIANDEMTVVGYEPEQTVPTWVYRFEMIIK